MDYEILHAVNAFVVGHALLASAVELFAQWIVPLVVAATLIPWLASGRGVDARKRATAGALVAASVAMLANQVIAHVWDRPRPYAAHASIVPLAGISSDPSFPSDHVAAAFAIAIAALVASRRAGQVLLVLAGLVAASRLLGAAHYPGDIIGGALVGAASGTVVMKFDRLWLPVASVVAAATDPLRLRLAEVPWIGRSLGDDRLRSRVVLLMGVAIGGRLALGIGGHLLDEMPLALLAGWAAAVVWLAREAGQSAHAGRPATWPTTLTPRPWR